MNKSLPTSFENHRIHQNQFCSLHHRVFLVFLVIVFQFNEKGAKARETRRVLSISVLTSFALLYIQLTITNLNSVSLRGHVSSNTP
ncbi:MAG: hypothetical protein C5S47_00910 [Candidatus Methanogasteraceae archaeon]|nr:MAG: hypothetical protein C5S47_00910 [ANME-2 cluster archaeon]